MTSEGKTAPVAISQNTLARLKPQRSPRLYSLEEYVKKEARASRKHEYFNGKIISKAYVGAPHNLISANTITAFGNSIDKARKDFVVLSSGQKVYFPTLNVGVYADALVVCEKMEFYDENELLLTNPILAVEVLSKSTRYYDRNGKFELYKTLPSFREYVLIERDRIGVETRFRVESNLWRDHSENDPAAEVFLESLGVSINLKDIYKRVNI